MASAKIAVLRASLRRGGGGGEDGGCSPRTVLSIGHERAIVRGPRASAAACSYGQHSLTEKADPPRRARAARESPLHVVDQDLLPASGAGRGRRQGRRGRDRAPSARPDDRQGDQARRSAPQQRRPQEVARGPAAPRRLRTRPWPMAGHGARTISDDRRTGSGHVRGRAHRPCRPGRLEVSGRWYGVRGRRFMRPTLTFRHRADGERAARSRRPRAQAVGGRGRRATGWPPSRSR